MTDVPDDSRPLHLLPGLEPTTVGWLQQVGIKSENDLRMVGAVVAYRRLKHWDRKSVGLDTLWVLHSVLTGIPLSDIDAATKARLLSDVYET